MQFLFQFIVLLLIRRLQCQIVVDPDFVPDFVPDTPPSVPDFFPDPPSLPDPSDSPTASPTNAPTWPAHMHIPKIVLHEPWFKSYTNAPTPKSIGGRTSVEHDIKIKDTAVYVPAKGGRTSLRVCIGFGASCEPLDYAPTY